MKLKEGDWFRLRYKPDNHVYRCIKKVFSDRPSYVVNLYVDGQLTTRQFIIAMRYNDAIPITDETEIAMLCLAVQ